MSYVIHGRAPVDRRLESDAPFPTSVLAVMEWLDDNQSNGEETIPIA